jgi:thioredoxin 1
MKTQLVTMENFDDVMEQNPLVVLDFWAEWCQPCKVFGPIFEQLAELNPEIFFGKVNTELSPDLAQAFQVRSIPTLMAFKGGELVFEKSGLIPPRDIEAMLELLRR